MKVTREMIDPKLRRRGHLLDLFMRSGFSPLHEGIRKVHLFSERKRKERS